jgi:hypothetical protein
VCGDADTATETKLRDESASLGVERSGEFGLDYDGFATVPFTETVQPSRGLAAESRRDGCLASLPPKLVTERGSLIRDVAPSPAWWLI